MQSGKSVSYANIINWKPVLMVIEEANMVKVLEGNYDNKDKPIGKKYERVI